MIIFIATTRVIVTPHGCTANISCKVTLKCCTNILPNSLTFLVNSAKYEVTHPSLNSTYMAAINQTGLNISVQCIWSAIGLNFTNETTIIGNHFNNFINYNAFVAPATPILNVTNEFSTTITVNWVPIPDANGYLVYFNELYDLIGSDNTSITVDKLIPGTNYSISVRAYEDILGSANITYATTKDGKYQFTS